MAYRGSSNSVRSRGKATRQSNRLRRAEAALYAQPWLFPGRSVDQSGNREVDRRPAYSSLRAICTSKSEPDNRAVSSLVSRYNPDRLFFLKWGSPGWAVNRFRSGVLVAFANSVRDQIDQESNEGAARAICRAMSDLDSSVKTILNDRQQMTAEQTALLCYVADYSQCCYRLANRALEGKINKVYAMQELQAIKFKRDRIAEICRFWQGTLSATCDWELVDRLVAPFRNVYNERPQSQQRLGKMIRRLEVGQTLKRKTS